MTDLPTPERDPSPMTSIHSSCSPWLMPLVYPLGCWVVLPLFFGRITVTGQEHLPSDGPVILAPMHRSRWDSILVAAMTGRFVTGRDVRFMVTIDECQGFQGWLVRHLGGFPVNPRQPAIASLRYGIDVLRDRQMLVIFPEGGIFRGEGLHPLKPGLARLALQAEALQPGLNVKIVPISIQYSQSIPKWGTDVTLHMGQPLETSRYQQGSAKQNAQSLTTDLETALQDLLAPQTDQSNGGRQSCSSV